MDLSAAQHQLHHYNHQLHQEMGPQSDPQSLDGVIMSSNPGQNQQQQDHKKPRPQDTEAQMCPRCKSTNTKFCYYNNYSLTQPRYFCKKCRRYWTKGGTLRNVPVGGGCRKNKRSSSSSPSFSSSSFIKKPHSQDMAPATVAPPTPALNHLFSNLQLPADFSSPVSYAGGLGLGFDVMGGANITGCESFVGYPHGGSFLKSLGIFQNASHGFGIGNDNAGGGSSNSVSGISEEMGLMPHEDVASTTGGGGGSSTATTTAVPLAAVKQEISNINSRGGWEFPWHINGDYGSMINVAGADLEPIRESWNVQNCNFVWPGLIDSPALM